MADSSPFLLDMRPLPQPVNPFAHIAGELRKRHGGGLKGEDLTTVEWLEWLGTQSPKLVTQDRTVILCLAAAAAQKEVRELIGEALDIINRELNAAD